jgi:hypothetical protein
VLTRNEPEWAEHEGTSFDLSSIASLLLLAYDFTAPYRSRLELAAAIILQALARLRRVAQARKCTAPTIRPLCAR